MSTSVGGGGLTGYKSETCLGTGKPWSGLGSYNLQIKPGVKAYRWSSIQKYCFRLVKDDLQNQKPYVITNAMWHQREVVKIKS